MPFDKTKRVVTNPPMISDRPSDNTPGDHSDALQAQHPFQHVMLQQVMLARSLRARGAQRKRAGTVPRPQIQ